MSDGSTPLGTDQRAATALGKPSQIHLRLEGHHSGLPGAIVLAEYHQVANTFPSLSG